VKITLISLILIGVGATILLTFFPSEEKRVKKQFHLLAASLSKETGENIFTMDQKLKKIGSFFNEACEIHIPAYALSGRVSREEIIAYATRGRIQFRELLLKFHDFNIAFPKDDEARVQLTARLTGKTATGEAVNEAHEVDSLLAKIEKKWMFIRVEVVEILKK